jgi:ribosomal protein S19E (S16A)
MQAIITEINEKIGAAGVVSQECKTVVSQYGQQILDLLLAEVCVFQTMDLLFWLLVWSVAFEILR